MSSLTMLPAHLLLHPGTSRVLKVLATTAGRDKLYRLVQYFSRFLAFQLLLRDHKDLAARFDGLKAGLASGRKLMRLFKPVEHLQAATRAGMSDAFAGGGAVGRIGEVERVAQIARQLAYAGYLSTDMLIYLQSVKFLRLTPTKVAETTKLSQRFWLAGILLSLLSTGAGLLKVRKETKRADLVVDREKGDSQRAKALVARHSQLLTQALQDSFDFFLPASNLGLVSVSEGKIGAIGAITSWMALSQMWAKA